MLFAPLLWLGNSHHHLDFPGTVSASPRVYLDLLIDLAESFLFHGFRRFVLLNGHGGNIVPAQQALFELRQRYRSRNDLLLLSATYWSAGDSPNEADSSIPANSNGPCLRMGNVDDAADPAAACGRLCGHYGC